MRTFFCAVLPRGTIYDAEMKELAISTMVSSLYIDPNHVEDPEQTARDEKSDRYHAGGISCKFCIRFCFG